MEDLFDGTDSAGHQTRCVSSIASSQEADSRIFLGAPFNSANYVVYDMTPADERNLDYIQIGIATKNPVNQVGQSEYSAQTQCQYQKTDQSISTTA